jgi:hypothetical protein
MRTGEAQEGTWMDAEITGKHRGAQYDNLLEVNREVGWERKRWALPIILIPLHWYLLQ